MTPEQALFWRRLQLDPELYAHDSGQELATIKNKREFSARVNSHLEFILANFESRPASCIVKTWLSVYDLPLDPKRISCWTEFHNSVGVYVRDNLKDIEAYSL